MVPQKVIWYLRALLYKFFLGELGSLSYIGKPLYFSGMRRIFIKKRVRIHPNARIAVVDVNSSIVFEENISIAQNCHITSCGRLIIGADTVISANVMVTNIDHDYRMIDKPVLEQPLLEKETRIGKNCFLGYGAVIQAGTILGKQCIVGSNAVVRGIFPDYSVIVGVPAKIVKRYNKKTKQWDKTDENGEFLNEE